MAYFLQGLFGIDNEDNLSKIKSFLDDLTIQKGKWKSWYQNAQAQKFIKKNFPIKSYDEIKRGDKIWLFGIAPQNYVARVEFVERKNSSSEKMVTLYYKKDMEYEQWVNKNNLLSNAFEVGNVAYADRGIYYKSQSKAKEIPLG
jgi:hypothetical protein